MYECTICSAVNHDSRLHCQVCGAIPANYSPTGKPARIIDSDSPHYYTNGPRLIPVANVSGFQAHDRIQTRVNFRTVELDYYADSE